VASPRSAYLLLEIPPDLRKALSETAAREDRSISGVVRSALCEHYELEPPVWQERSYQEKRDRGNPQMVIRAPRKLFTAVKKEAKKSRKTMRQVILDILADRFLVRLGS